MDNYNTDNIISYQIPTTVTTSVVGLPSQLKQII